MLLTALLLALSLAPSSAEAPASLTARADAATTLRAALERAEDLEGGARMAVLRAASRVAVNQLGAHRSAQLVEAAVVDARWRAMVDDEAAGADLWRALDGLASDLTFQPYVEAPLPEGWPALTAVNEIELLAYPRYRMATTSMEGSGNNRAFWNLFRHIERNEIAMTAPVEMTLDDRGEREVTMAFLYQAPDQAGEAFQDAVRIVDAEPALAISMGLRGYDTDDRVGAARAELEAWLALNPRYVADGAPRVLSYNSPMVPRTRRFFEVQLPVRLAVSEARPTVPADAF